MTEIKQAGSGIDSAIAVQAHIDAGIEHHAAGRFRQAEQCYRRAIDAHPDNSEAQRLLGVLALQAGRPDKALSYISSAIAADPNNADAHTNMGLVKSRMGDFEAALACHHKALAISPNDAETLNNLGNLLHEMGREDEAITSFQAALQVEPDAADLHCNLGNVMTRAGRADEALSCYRCALKYAPDYPEAHGNIAELLLRLGHLSEAAKHFDHLLRLKPDHVDAAIGLARAHLMMRNTRQAIEAAHHAVALQPDAPAAQLLLARAQRRAVPAWHVPMMNDHDRNAAYHSALKLAVRSDTHVLEIGTGSGLLAMMAAQLGAAKVTTCEMEPAIAAAASEIIEANGFSDRITVHACASQELSHEGQLGGPADILVAEILSSEFLGEGVLSALEDAKARLLKPDAQLIPAGGDIMISVFGGDALGEFIHAATVSGFDLSAFNKITSKKFPLQRYDLAIELLSDAVSAFSFDFMSSEAIRAERKRLQLPMQRAGTAHGIIQWHKLRMDADTVFENHPLKAGAASAWTHTVYAFDEPVGVDAGDIAVISAAHDRIAPWFALKGIERTTSATAR